MAERFSYFVAELERGRAAFDAFAKHMLANNDSIGVFAGQLGFASNEAAVLMKASGTLAHAPHVVSKTHETLAPTIRPTADSKLKPGGIYVHRWFTVDHASLAEFIELSGKAWPSFEEEFDATIFGLFTAERSEHDIAQAQTRLLLLTYYASHGVWEASLAQTRLLLLTYYASHGVWEASRRPTREPQGLFMKRHQLTRTTVGRSTLLVTP